MTRHCLIGRKTPRIEEFDLSLSPAYGYFYPYGNKSFPLAHGGHLVATVAASNQSVAGSLLFSNSDSGCLLFAVVMEAWYVDRSGFGDKPER